MDEEPLVRIVRGTPTAEELAALVTVVASRARRGSVYADSHPAGSLWARTAHPAFHPRSWRSAGLPGVIHRAR
ncbi:acyl-CoA carboxylase subunit epsilon [Actinoplanes sp. NPDC051633]|uniref:acyl-CoA carboxylase subunit epsilon n=1 Tax=Actinoplanes sp. NPDC051633 TaxID=3155670 RepID=UPI00343C5BCE